LAATAARSCGSGDCRKLADQLTEFAEQAWQDLEIEPEGMLVRFESARINFR